MSRQQDILTLPHDQIEAIQLEGVKKTVIKCYENVEFYKKSFDAAGFNPYEVASLEDLAKAPFTTKQDLRDNYPYGFFAVPLSEVKEIHRPRSRDLGRLLCPRRRVREWRRR